MIPRLLALVVAAAMVVGAVAVRGRLDDDSDQRAGPAGSLSLVCSTELAETCRLLAADDRRITVTVEEASATADRLTTNAGDDVDGWLVAGPWAGFVAEPRRQAGLPDLTTGAVLASSPVGLVVWPDRAQVLKGRCAGTGLDWKCLGEVAGLRWADIGGPEAWGPVKPGHPPVTSASGLAVVGAATAGYFGRTDLARADLDDDGYRDWLARLERAIPSPTATPLEDMLVRGPSAFDAVGTIEAHAGTLIAQAARPDKPLALYPSPMATADVTLASAPGSQGERLAKIVNGKTGRVALQVSGWRPGAGAKTNGLPDPGVLDALRGVVAEAAR